MIREEVNTIAKPLTIGEKLRAYVAFAKLKLATSVVFSAFICYLYAADTINWLNALYLSIGGFLVTGASNGFNQVIEKDLDKLMSRTSSRPIPTGKMSATEGIVVAFIMGIVGVSILWFCLNPLSGLLGALALILYVGFYTPMKRVSPFAVFIGAFPGAIPPMIGYVAVTGELDLIAGLLFAIQFVWQFPHFWAIAWRQYDDYGKAGYSLLPSPGGKDRSSAFQSLVYSLFLIPTSLLPFYFELSGWISAIVIGIAGLWFAWYSYKLYSTLDDKVATKIMFASFLYLPVVQIALVLDKI